MFGNQSLPSVIYSYGAKEPTLNSDRVWDQLRASHRYRNTLCEIELRRRERSESVVAKYAPELAGLTEAVRKTEAELDAALSVVKSVNKRDRKQSATKEQRDAVKRLRVELKRLRAEHKAARMKGYKSPEAEKDLAAVNALALDEQKAARAASELFWGTYLATESACKSFRSGPPPRFRRWTGDGKLAVQIQGGMTINEAFLGNDTRFRLDPVQSFAFDKGVPQRFRRTQAWLRIGTEDDGRTPIWTCVPVTLHRPVPSDAAIKWVYLTARRKACHTEWSLCLVLSRESGWSKTDTAYCGDVGIDLGWRIVQNGLRVAYWVGSDEDQGELVLPTADVARWEKANDLRSIRDQRFNEARDRLVEWLAGRELPDWLVERTRTLRQWRSQARLASLVLFWRENRFDGDTEAFETVEAWRKKDKHLYEWEDGNRRKAVAWRDDLYRNFAATLSRRYRTVHLEDANWKQLAQHAPEGESDDRTGQSSRHIAAPGRLREILRERFAETVLELSVYTTQRCFWCGGMGQFDAKPSVMVQCRQCGKLFDQDENAARNLLASAVVAAGTP